MIWKPIVGYEGLYEASDAGEIRRVAPGKRTQPGRILTSAAAQGRYRIVKLYRGTTKADHRYFSVHGLIAVTFLGPRPEKGEVNHKNGIKTDNRVENLEYTTRLGNAQHAARSGLYVKGEQVKSSKLTVDDVRAMRALRTCGWTQRKLASAFGISQATAWSILHRIWWKDV